MDATDNSWVIVAIPDPDDYVWKISSEKIPHMTILYLGEPPSGTSAENIVEYMQHTANTSLRRFGLQADRRGPLGSENADVVFFDDPGWGDMRMLKDARSHLLKNDEIKKAYDSVEQYPEWTPHLTLGYPAAPAKEDDRDYPGVHWVKFDRLALWTADFEGFVVPLKTDDRMEVRMSENPTDAFLAHFGVKGMKWGVRKQRASVTVSSPAKPPPKKATAPEGKPTVNKSGRITSAPKQKADPGAKKTRDEMSDEELRRAINRIDMEKRFTQLTAPPPSKVSAASKFVADILMDVGKTQAKALLNGLATKQLVKQGLAQPPKKSKS